MVRVMVGDALVFEHERLQQRMNQFFDRIESTLRQVPARQRFRNAHCARSGTGQRVDLVRVGTPATFCALGLSPHPTEHLDASLALMLH